MRRFENRVAVVTGAAGGIGRAIAQRLGSEGARVVLVDLDLQRLQDVVSGVEKFGAPESWATACDVSVESQVAAALDATLQRFGRLDVVVNNAGVMSFKPLHEFTGEDWNRILSVDLLGAFFFIKHAFTRMKPGSAIVNISSIHAVQTAPLAAPYAAAKAALLSLTRTAALEGQSRGIRTNAILPGAIDTPMLRENPDVKSGVEHIDPEEVGKPADVAAAVAFLASDDAAFVQGASLVVDGGRIIAL